MSGVMLVALLVVKSSESLVVLWVAMLVAEWVDLSVVMMVAL